MTAPSIDQLKLRAARDDYPSMAALARALLVQGKSQEEVLRTCYGAPFPGEFFVFLAMLLEDRAPPAQYTGQPWNLVWPLDRGGPFDNAGPWEAEEKQVFALAPALVTLMAFPGYAKHSDVLLCYDLGELAGGRPTIFGLPMDPKPGDMAERSGDSLAAVIHEHFVDELRALEREYASPSNRGAGSVDEGELNVARESLAQAEEFVRAVADRERLRGQ